MVSIEIHWNLTLPGEPYTIDPAELWSGAVPMLIAGVPVRRLSLEDLLLHLCVHTSYNHQFECGLRPSCDIAALVQRYGDRIDWDAVCRRSARRRWSKGVSVALALARQLLGAEVPAEVLCRLEEPDAADAVESACRLSWLTADERAAFTSQLAALGSHAAWSHRVRRGWACLVPSSSELAWMYSVQPGTAWLPLYYLRRVYDLLRTHGPSAFRLVAGRDPELQALAARRDHMRQWLLDS
jgi:hypothetical protein